MRKQWRIKDFQNMYDDVTNPEKIEENKRKNERKERIQDRIDDYGV